MEIKRSARATGGSTRRQVYEVLRASIETVEFPPGLRLSENDLAERFGVSRTPVREALLGLRDDRLVEIVPQLGTFVARITHSALEDAQFIRTSLECAAVGDAAADASDDDIAALRAIVARQAQTRDSADLAHFYVLDDEFHASLCTIGGRAVAWSISQRASGHLNRVRRLSLPVHDYIAEMVSQHTAVVDAVAAHDPVAAHARLRDHLGAVLVGLGEIAQEHPDYFEEEADRAWALSLSARLEHRAVRR
ncbi:MAG TPA: GntR family transcriptional regulator [Solirubrobacteraceae bacterium]|nr:GntR family transcriptional regulator [Solirubrobacteraceae bacterium]